MEIRPNLAARSYAQALSAAAPIPREDGDGAFARIAGSFVDTLARGEATARAAMTGNADPHALVEALSASRLAVETAVTVRDRVVEAYQEILRMPV